MTALVIIMNAQQLWKTPGSHFHSTSGFSLAEAVVALGIAVLSVTGAMQINSHQLRLVKSVRESSAASQTMEERVEALRIATWRQITDASYYTGTYFAARPKSVAPLDRYIERVTVSAWPPSKTGALLAVEKHQNEVARVAKRQGDIASERLAKVDVRITWRGKDNRERVRELCTIVSNGGLSRMNLPAMGAAAGSPSAPAPVQSSEPNTTATPAPTTSVPASSSGGNGRGNIGGKPGRA